MADIEWQATSELQPRQASVAGFCRENHIPDPGLTAEGLPLVFIEKEALASLYDYLESDQRREHGGVLAGFPYLDPTSGQYFVAVRKVIPAMDSEGSGVHLKFTSASWGHIAGILEEEGLPGLSVVGWFHSHPGLGVFMSATDQATQRAFYHHPWSLAVVVDPRSQRTGWFAGPESLPLATGEVTAYQQPGQAPEPVGQPEKLAWEIETGYEVPSGYRWLLPAAAVVLIFASSYYFLRHIRA